MSGVDERVERVNLEPVYEALKELAIHALPTTSPQRIISIKRPALAALDSLAAAVADAEQRADDAEKALREIAGIDPDEWLAGRGWDCVKFIQEKALAAAVVSAEPTEEQG